MRAGRGARQIFFGFHRPHGRAALAIIDWVSLAEWRARKRKQYHEKNRMQLVQEKNRLVDSSLRLAT
jgi:hypothetical protein